MTHFLLGVLGTSEMLLILPIIFWLWMLVDIIKNTFTESNNKTIWVIVSFIIPVMVYISYSRMTSLVSIEYGGGRSSTSPTLILSVVVSAIIVILYLAIGKKQQTKKSG